MSYLDLLMVLNFFATHTHSVHPRGSQLLLHQISLVAITFEQTANRSEPVGKVYLTHSPGSDCSKGISHSAPCRWLPFRLSPFSCLLSSLLFSMVSCACCFNSLLITSHVPHKVLILRRSCMGTRHKRQFTQKCLCEHQSEDPPASRLGILRAHAYLIGVLCGYILSFARFP